MVKFKLTSATDIGTTTLSNDIEIAKCYGTVEAEKEYAFKMRYKKIKNTFRKQCMWL